MDSEGAMTMTPGRSRLISSFLQGYVAPGVVVITIVGGKKKLLYFFEYRVVFCIYFSS